jgi:hypothetical protein
MTARDASSLQPVDVERIRRMAECWQLHDASDFEVSMARRRIAARDAERPLPKAFGALIGLAAVTAALAMPPFTGMVERDFGTLGEGVPEASGVAMSASGHSARTGSGVPLIEAEALAPAMAPASAAQPIPAVRNQPAAPTARRARVRRLAVTQAPKPEPVALRVELRFDDNSDPGYRPDPLTRDVAALSRAYLWVSDGRAEQARELLEQLADTGATLRIRRRASELLLRAAEAPPSSQRIDQAHETTLS